MSIAKENSEVTLRQAAQAVSDQWDGTDWVREDMPRINSAYSALRTALAAPEQEPVGYAFAKRDFIGSVIGAKGEWAPHETPLYAAPVDIEAFTKERDEWKNTAIQRGSEYIKMLNESDALMQAAKLALDALVLLNGDAHLEMMSDDGPAGTYANKVFHKTCLSLAALKKAGVQ